MKLPDTSALLSQIKRGFDSNIVQSLVYFEKGMLERQGQRVFIITEDKFYVTSNDARRGILHQVAWADVDSVEVIPDAASYFDDEKIAVNAKHIRIHHASQGNDQDQLDFFSIYEDSRLLFTVDRTWRQCHVAECFPVLYSRRTQTKMRTLSNSNAATLAADLVQQLTRTATPVDDGKGSDTLALHDTDTLQGLASTLDELTVAVASSPYFKKLCFENVGLLSFVMKELSTYSPVGLYFDEAELAGVTRPERELARIKFLHALLGFLYALCAGSEGVPERVNLLAPPSPFTVETLLSGVLLHASRDQIAAARANAIMEDINKSSSPRRAANTSEADAATQEQLEAKRKEQEEKAVQRARDNMGTNMRQVALLQVSLLYELEGLFEYARITETGAVSLDTMYTHIAGLADFKQYRLPIYFRNMVLLFTDPEAVGLLDVATPHAASFFHHSHVLSGMLKRSSAFRDTVKTINQPEIRLHVKQAVIQRTKSIPGLHVLNALGIDAVEAMARSLNL